MKSLSFNQQVLLGAGVGVVGGVGLNLWGQEASWAATLVAGCDLIGRGLFVGLLKMIVMPLIFVSVVTGLAHLRQHERMGTVWKTTLVYFLSTTALAVILGLAAVNIGRPGVGMTWTDLAASSVSLPVQDMTLATFVETFVMQLFLNPFEALAQGKVLPVIVFALLMGAALIVCPESQTRTLLQAFEGFFAVIMQVVNWIMRLLPIGLAALLISLLSTMEADLFLALGRFIAVVTLATLFHGLVVLPLIGAGVGGVSPRGFFSAMKEALMTAFSTSSSSATLPVTLRCVHRGLRVNDHVAGFVLPVGATMNMDGTALYEAVAAVFIANLTGIELNILQQMIVFITSIVAAIGAPGIPSAGMVTMVMVLQAVGLPVEAIAILLPIDRFLDAIRTTVNVTGDAVGCVVVDRVVNRSEDRARKGSR